MQATISEKTFARPLVKLTTPLSSNTTRKFDWRQKIVSPKSRL